MDWLSGSKGLFWIYGKPGSGKSTLMNHLAHNSRLASSLQQYSPMKWIVLRFFFDFRSGKGITNSFEGLLRSLLYQLIKKLPQIDVRGLYDSEEDSISDWPEHRLRDALRRSLESVKNGVCILVDGLDEYEGSFLILIPFLQSLATSNDSEKSPIKICVSSRPEPKLFQLLRNLPQLSMSNHNASGIQSYCSLRLKEMKLGDLEDLNTSRLSHIIAERAEGVFLWVRFAMDELFEGHSSGATFEEILERLSSIPDSLEAVYDRMLDRMNPLAKRECMFMLQLVCFAKWTLSLEEHHAATKFAMDRDLVIIEPTDGDGKSGSMPRMNDTYAKRLRAKSVGLLEPVRHGLFSFTSVKLIHRSVSTYLDQKGWQKLGESGSYDAATHESWYVKICIRYLHLVLLHVNPRNSTSQDTWQDSVDPNWNFYSRLKMDQVEASYPFLAYSAKWLFEHARSLEEQGVSSYPLLHDSLTEQLLGLHVSLAREEYRNCPACYLSSKQGLISGDLDPVYVSFLHGLVLYCKSDLSTRVPAHGQAFWDLALRCAIYSSVLKKHIITQEIVPLALQNITSVRQHHIGDCMAVAGYRWDPHILKLVLHHESVKDLRFTDGKGREVKLCWLFAQPFHIDIWHPQYNNVLDVLMEAARRRGEDVRQSCGPEGNLAETLLKQPPLRERREKLLRLRSYYDSMSWPFEYDADEIERDRPDKRSEEVEDMSSEQDDFDAEDVECGSASTSAYGAGHSENRE